MMLSLSNQVKSEYDQNTVNTLAVFFLYLTHRIRIEGVRHGTDNGDDEEAWSPADAGGQVQGILAAGRESMGDRIRKPDADRRYHFGAVPDTGYARAGVCRFMIPREGHSDPAPFVRANIDHTDRQAKAGGHEPPAFNIMAFARANHRKDLFCQIGTGQRNKQGSARTFINDLHKNKIGSRYIDVYADQAIFSSQGHFFER